MILEITPFIQPRFISRGGIQKSTTWSSNWRRLMILCAFKKPWESNLYSKVIMIRVPILNKPKSIGKRKETMTKPSSILTRVHQHESYGNILDQTKTNQNMYSVYCAQIIQGCRLVLEGIGH